MDICCNCPSTIFNPYKRKLSTVLGECEALMKGRLCSMEALHEDRLMGA